MLGVFNIVKCYFQSNGIGISVAIQQSTGSTSDGYAEKMNTCNIGSRIEQLAGSSSYISYAEKMNTQSCGSRI
eukprot:2110028-Ditylum_brightwellii.AAC.1